MDSEMIKTQMGFLFRILLLLAILVQPVGAEETAKIGVLAKRGSTLFHFEKRL